MRSRQNDNGTEIRGIAEIQRRNKIGFRSVKVFHNQQWETANFVIGVPNLPRNLYEHIIENTDCNGSERVHSADSQIWKGGHYDCGDSQQRKPRIGEPLYGVSETAQPSHPLRQTDSEVHERQNCYENIFVILLWLTSVY